MLGKLAAARRVVTQEVEDPELAQGQPEVAEAPQVERLNAGQELGRARQGSWVLSANSSLGGVGHLHTNDCYARWRTFYRGRTNWPRSAAVAWTLGADRAVRVATG